jgi:hypothetical protein
MKLIKNNIFTFIFLMMGATVFSKGFALVSYGLLFVYSFYYHFRNKIFLLEDFEGKKNLHVFLIFMIWAIISGVNGINPQKSLIALSAFVVFAFSYYPVKNVISGIDREKLLFLPKLIVYTMTPFCFYLIIKEIWLSELYNLDFKRHFPMVMTLVSPFFWFFFIKNNNKISTYIILANFVLALVVGDNRGAVLATVLGAIFFACLYDWKDKKQFVKLSIYGLFLVVLSIFIYIKTNPLAFNRLTNLSIQNISSGRNVLWNFSVDKIIEKPLIGYGAKTFKYQDFSGYNVNTKTHPHNIFLEIILETGFVGFFLLLYWFKGLLKDFKRSYSRKNEHSEIFMLFSLSFLLYFVINITSVSAHRLWFTVFPLYFLIMSNIVKEKQN